MNIALHTSYLRSLCTLRSCRRWIFMKNVTFSWNLYCFLAPKICLHELPPFKLKLKGNCDNLFSCKILKTFFFFLHIRLHLAWLPQDPLENLLKKRCLGIGFWFLLALFAIVWLLLAPALGLQVLLKFCVFLKLTSGLLGFSGFYKFFSNF